MESLTIADDTFVTLSYTLFDEQGEAVDRATAEEPLSYVHGYAQIVPGLEKRLEGLKAGDKKTFTIEPDEAFGERDDDGVLQVDKTDFPDAGEVVTGDEFMAQGPDGEPIAMRVIEVRDDSFIVDTNHPLAGQKVRFEVEVASVRAATDEEIAEAEADLEERADEADDGCCGHDHDGEHGHDHDHDHDHDHGAPPLVQLSKKH
ncbi:MAG: peptidylprolyl isomerase [Byssovorax sp.]